MDREESSRHRGAAMSKKDTPLHLEPGRLYTFSSRTRTGRERNRTLRFLELVRGHHQYFALFQAEGGWRETFTEKQLGDCLVRAA